MTSTTRFDSLPSVDQFDVWHDAVSNTFVPLDATCRAEHAFGGELIVLNAGAIQLSEVSGGAVDVERSSRTIRLSDPGYLKLGMQVCGSCLVSQDRREASLSPGDFAIYDTRRPYQLSFDNDFSMLVVMFPRELLNLPHQDLTKLTARRFSGRVGIGGVVGPFLNSLAKQVRTDDVTLNFELSVAVIDLLAATFSEYLERECAVCPETHQHALVLKIKSFIDERLHDPELSTATIAVGNHISPRYLQKLFESENTTVTGWIRRRRLEHCSRELANPRYGASPISKIANRWGMVDASHFARIFRATYGMSPREFRVQNIGR